VGLLVATAEVFTTAHIAVTAAISGGLAFVAAILIMGRGPSALSESAILGVLTAAAVFLWRKSANLPQLNTDGLHGFSANDWLAPTVTYVWLSVYAHLRSPPDPGRYRKSQAAATLIALAVNVITI
jgi:hypothetical protein